MKHTLEQLNQLIAEFDARRWTVMKSEGIDSEAFHQVSVALFEMRHLRAAMLDALAGVAPVEAPEAS